MTTKKTFAALGAALMLSTAATAAFSTELVVYHSWSSGPEVAALNVIKSGIEAKGHTWEDIAIPHNTGSNVNLMNLVTGGSPPNVFMESSPGVFRDLSALGMGRPLTEFFNEMGYTAQFPDSVTKSITVDGEIMKVPTAIHIDGMAYFNKEVAEAAGVDPSAWTSLDAMFADFDKVADAGYVPIAIGGQQWQVGYLTHALAAATGGVDFYMDIYGSDPDVGAVNSDEMRDLLAALRKFQQAADEGSANREWNVTTNMVITGQALMQIHGDWMKGEWSAAGKTAGEDFGCIQIPGAQAVVVTVDSWGLLGGQSDEYDQAQLDFASVVVDPAVQAEFALEKGSTPVRLDAPASALDACSTEVLNILSDPERQVQNPHSMADADWQNSIWDVVFNFWSDPDMSADDAIAQMEENYDIILG